MEDSNRNNRDPFDPFSEKEEVFESKNIKTSKAGRLNAKKSAAVSVVKKKKVPFFKRVARTIRSFFEREDKKRIYLAFGVSLFLIAGIVVLYFAFIEPWQQEEIKIIEVEKVKTEIESTHTDFFLGNLNKEEDLENYKLEIEEKYNSTNDPDLKFLYRKELINYYFDDEEKNKEVIGWINEQLSYKKITILEKANYLATLVELYKMNGMTGESKNALNELLKIPDDDEMTLGGETLTELKARIKNENS